MARHYAVALEGKGKVDLGDYDPADTAGLKKEQANARLEKLGEELRELTNLLTFSGLNALLVVFQGRDASGKDGSIRKVLEFSNVLASRVEGFKVPTDEERNHDFLWRIHQAAPRRAQIALFNRSHYEDVIAARVHKLVPEDKLAARYDHINAFERLLADNDTLLVKFYLHVSREEQYQRLREREEGPLTAWKLSPGDWRELPLWKDTTRAYEDALARCSSKELPFYLVPADKKWFRNLAVVERLVLTLRPHRQRWLDHLARRAKEAIAEIEVLRRQLEGKPRRGARTPK